VRIRVLTSWLLLSTALSWTACSFGAPAKLHLVPLHAAPEYLESLAGYYQDKLGIEVEILPALQPPTAVFNDARRQLIAEGVIGMLRTTYAAQARSGVVIGVTSWDMYIEDRPWIFGFSLREPPYAVVSYARMDPRRLGGSASAQLLQARLRKMVSRNVGIMIFGLKTNPNRDSLMYQDVMGVDELDRLDEDLAAAGFPIPAR
jgi:predicted Zn-dependent protease